MNRRSIGLPLAVGITLSVLAGVLAVGWQVLTLGNLGPVAEGLTGLHWTFLILGSIFFVLIIIGLLLLCIWLAREIRFSQRQQAFLDAVTHEMKTPLAALRLYLETLGRHDPGPERRARFLGRMEEDVERLERTVGQVLAAARADSPRSTPPEEPLDLTELLREAAHEIALQAQLPDEAIQIDRKRPLVALGDTGELGLVFRNLLENAVKYSEPPVEVRVSLTAPSEGRVRVEIADRGIGIEPGELKAIFQRFYRAGRDVQRQAAGLGLGLFIVRNLVRRNGGRVEATSEGTGHGSRFVVTLRAAPTGAPQVGPAPVAVGRA